MYNNTGYFYEEIMYEKLQSSVQQLADGETEWNVVKVQAE